jgi:hypothetical protein
MIYITPTKKLKSEAMLEHAKNFAKRNLSDPAQVTQWVGNITEQTKCTHSTLDTLRISVEHEIDLGSDNESVWSQALILNKALTSNLQSSKFVIKAGIELPHEIEKRFRESNKGKSVSERLTMAIDAYNKSNNETFSLKGVTFSKVVLGGYIERKALSSRASDLEDQTKRLTNSFKKHIEFKIKSAVQEFIPIMKEFNNNFEKKHEISLER